MAAQKSPAPLKGPSHALPGHVNWGWDQTSSRPIGCAVGGVIANSSRERGPGTRKKRRLGGGHWDHGASDHSEEDETERAGAATAHAVSSSAPEPRG